MREPPWGWPTDVDFTVEHQCPRCGEMIPPRWRHYWRPCVCTYTPLDRPPHDADPDCEICDGTGYPTCEPQDLTFLRKWGACATCGARSFEVIDTRGNGVVEGSGRHAEGEQPDHVVTTIPVPLVRAIGDYLDDARRRDDDASN